MKITLEASSWAELTEALAELIKTNNVEAPAAVEPAEEAPAEEKPKKATKKKLPMGETEVQKTEEKAPEEPKYTLDQLTEAAMPVIADDPAAMEEIRSFLVNVLEVESLPELTPDKYAAFAKKIRQMGAAI